MIFQNRYALPLFFILPCALALLCSCHEQASAEKEITCNSEISQGGNWYPSSAPFEGGNDSGRTHLFRGCTGLRENSKVTLASKADHIPGTYNIVTRADGAIYALAGSYGRITPSYGPFVVSLNAHDLKERWRTALPNIDKNDWNYPGAIGVHRNGDLYVIYGRHLVRINPTSGALKASALLPTNQPGNNVSYNGFVLLSDGKIAAKSIHRQVGCDEPDFQAFFHCKTTGMSPSTLVLINPETMGIDQTLITPEHTRFRLTSTKAGEVEYVYIPGEHRLYRYRYASGQLSFDDTWQPEYLLPGQTAGTAVAAFGDWVVIQTNGMPTQKALSIVALSQRDPLLKFRIEPFADSSHLGSFMPSMPTVDIENNRIYAFDGYAGGLAALDFNPKSGFSIAWKVSQQRSFAFSALVGPKSARTLISTNISDFLPNFLLQNLDLKRKVWLTHLAVIPREELVWRDAVSGHELGRSKAIAAVAGSALTPGPDGSLYVPDLKDHRLIRLAATGRDSSD